MYLSADRWMNCSARSRLKSRKSNLKSALPEKLRKKYERTETLTNYGLDDFDPQKCEIERNRDLEEPQRSCTTAMNDEVPHVVLRSIVATYNKS